MIIKNNSEHYSLKIDFTSRNLSLSLVPPSFCSFFLSLCYGLILTSTSSLAFAVVAVPFTSSFGFSCIGFIDILLGNLDQLLVLPIYSFATNPGLYVPLHTLPSVTVPYRRLTFFLFFLARIGCGSCKPECGLCGSHTPVFLYHFIAGSCH